MIPRKKLDIPAKVSGRTVTNRGVHLLPFAYHGRWLEQASYWTDLLVSMGMSWVVILTSSDSVRQKYDGVNPLQVLLDAGIIPIIREVRKFPHPFLDHDTFRWTVDLYGQYGLKPFWIIRNEPFDDREWKKREVPEDAWNTIMSVWCGAAAFIAANGGYVGFPDGPGYDTNPFESIKAYGLQPVFDAGLAFYAGHHYGKNRPRDYPYDAVTRYGAQLTEQEYRRLLDDFVDERYWLEEPLELINQRRSESAKPGLTAPDDITCWRGWEQIARWSLETFGYVVPMAMTEGGWVPRDRPGSGPDTDIRVPHTTPKLVARKTLQMFDTPSPFFALCPWLLADTDMGGVGWPYDAWHGWAFSEKYGSQKPVITTLCASPPKEVKLRSEPLVIDVEGDTRTWSWAQEKYGTRYRRGIGSLRLIEVHEYEGPAVFDVWVVDQDGLPVEGVPFYHFYPGAPVIPTTRGGRGPSEWYARGAPRVTGPDGRVSFAAVGKACAPGAGQVAIWPQGRGDVLEKLGFLPGTRNRHVRGLWQMTVEHPPAGAVPPSATPPQALPDDPWRTILDKVERIETLITRLPE